MSFCASSARSSRAISIGRILATYGIDRRRDYDPECFACHTNGFQFTGGFTLYEDTPAMAAVQCESCHGAGADHCDAPLLPYSRPGEAACLRCHVPLHSPEFDYGTYLPKVAHPKAP